MMKDRGLVDLHMHCKASDGTDTVYELLERVRAAGITTFAVTDHDTIEGAVEMESIVSDDVNFIRGVEFSCITDAGKCHILAYEYDKDSQELHDILEKGSEMRKGKLKLRLDYLKEEFGIEITDEKREELFAMDAVGKPHLGNLLVSMGFAENKRDAIKKYIDPCKTGSGRLDAGEVIRAIAAAGGIPVWAHPYGGTDEREVSQEQFEKQLELLMGEGLLGLECYYSKYSEEQVSSLLNAAASNHLLVSGGSDYHGLNKKVALGTLNNYGEVIGAEKLSVLAELDSRSSQ